MFSHYVPLKKKTTMLAPGCFNLEQKKVHLALSFKSFVFDDIRLSLNRLSLFAFKLSQHLTFRNKLTEREFLRLCVSCRILPGSRAESLCLTLTHAQDLIQTLNALHLASKKKQKPISKRIFTVIRSPFIYKKTREQFALRRHTVSIVLKLAPDQAEWLIPMLIQLRLPCELKICAQTQG